MIYIVKLKLSLYRSTGSLPWLVQYPLRELFISRHWYSAFTPCCCLFVDLVMRISYRLRPKLPPKLNSALSSLSPLPPHSLTTTTTWRAVLSLWTSFSPSSPTPLSFGNKFTPCFRSAVGGVLHLALTWQTTFTTMQSMSCANCGCMDEEEGISLKACKSCMLVKYCNPTCQRNHWPNHKGGLSYLLPSNAGKIDN